MNTPIQNRRCPRFSASALILTLVLIPLASAVVSAQGIDAKLDADLRLLLAADQRGDRGAQRLLGATDELALFVKGDPAAIRQLVVSLGGRVGATVGTISTARIPRAALPALAASPDVQRLEASSPVVMYNDDAAKAVGADKVRRPQEPGVEALTGKGVLVGLVDTGIDFTHPDFRMPDDTNRSRIVAIWDQPGTTGDSPENFGYGSLWTHDQIENALRTGVWSRVRHYDSIGHGTHTSGTAAGNGSALGRFSGMAPEADIVMVALDPRRSTSLVEAIQFIFEKADSMGVPAVVNLSLGLDQFPHDGTSLLDQSIDNMLSERAGRVVCASAGNSGLDMDHARLSPAASESWVWLRAEPLDESDQSTVAMLRTSGIVLNSDVATLQLAIEADSIDASVTPGRAVAFRTSAWQPLQSLVQRGITSIQLPGTAGHPGAAAYIMFAQQNEREARFMLYLLDTLNGPGGNDRMSGSDLYRVIFKGTGGIHLWRASADTVELSDVTPASDAGLAYWDRGWVIKSPGTARNVLTVGASNNATRYLNVLGDSSDTEPEGGAIGELAVFSSAGPTLDGRMKPEIVAPGKGVISCLSRTLASQIMTDEELARVAEGGKHICMSGTSMSCPVTVGSIALMLQKYPTLTFQQVKDAITSTARRDAQTAMFGPLPNNFWGYGKLDIAAAIRGLSAVEASDAARGSLRATVSPNPAASRATLTVDLPHSGRLHAEVLDLLGRTVSTLFDGQVDATRSRLDIDLTTLAAGTYYCVVRAGERTTMTPLVVQE